MGTVHAVEHVPGQHTCVEHPNGWHTPGKHACALGATGSRNDAGRGGRSCAVETAGAGNDPGGW